MSFYGKHVLPRLTHLVCNAMPVRRQREKLIPRARGRVLEIGSGSGLNLPYYDQDKVVGLWALDPSREMTRLAKRLAVRTPFPITFLVAPAEDIPLEDNSVDTIVTTYAMCSIPDLAKAFTQMARVLRPAGQLLFCEHGVSPEPGVRIWQERLAPYWKKVAGGCNLNRDIPELIGQGGLRVTELESGPIAPMRLLSFTYRGVAMHQEYGCAGPCTRARVIT